MLDDDLHALADGVADGVADARLDRLEANVWAGIQNDEASRRTTRVIISCQAMVLVAALFGSAAVGAAATSVQPHHPALSLGSAHLAPSTLLLGGAP